MLYKYRNCKDENGNRNTFIEGIVKEGEMFFAVPSLFEDVHDCELDIKLYAKNSLIRKFWKQEIIPNDRDFLKICQMNGWFGNPQKFAKYYNESPKKEKADRLGIHCLCETAIEREMWNKYACFEGICIGYETSYDASNYPIIKFKETIHYPNMVDNYLPFYKITYKNTGHPIINRLPTDKFQESVKNALLIKDECWRFEKEHRAFVFNENIGMSLGKNGIVLHCTDATIKEIIFSQTAHKDTIDWVVGLIDSRPCERNGVRFLKNNGSMNVPLSLV